MDLVGIPLVDAHCHAFDIRTAASRDLADMFSLSEDVPAPGMMASTVLVRGVVLGLAARLGCEPTLEAVAAARRTAFGADPEAYVRSLFADAGIATLLLDTGHPVHADGTIAVDSAGFAAAAGVRHRTIHRFDNISDRVASGGQTFAERIDEIALGIDAAIAGGAVGLKSIVAYWTGLDIDPPTREAAERAYASLAAGRRNDPATKPYFDFVFVLGLQKAIEHGVPIQLHTGMGDGPAFDMSVANPILLRRILADPAFRRASIVLTHAGYPWVEEAAWIANQYDNVHIDISEMAPFAAPGLRAKLAGLLEMCPTSKLMYASDGINGPEVHWIAARATRRALGEVLDGLRTDGWLGEGDALEIGCAVLHDNAARLYGLEAATP